MQYGNFDKKVRFSYFLPYGITTPAALELSIPSPSEAYCEFSPTDNIESRILTCNHAHKLRLEAVLSMEQYGYTTTDVFKYGPRHYETVRGTRLTPSGLYVLTNTEDEEAEKERREKYPRVINRRKKVNSYLPLDEESVIARKSFNDLAARKNNSPEEANDFLLRLLPSVFCGELSILASEPILAKAVSALPSARSNQIYKAIRLANITALFAANGFLTGVDKRPLDAAYTEEYLDFKKRRIEDISKKDDLDITEFTEYVLYRWYEQHPECGYFLNPEIKMEGAALDEWRTTPAFYALADLPGFTPLSNKEEAKNINPRNTLHTIKHTAMGVAIGTESNYIVYHTKPVKTPWLAPVEASAAEHIQLLLNEHAAKHNTPGGNRGYDTAIMVCPTIHQFADLFAQAKKTFSRSAINVHRVGSPFRSINIVPLNHSGLMQLRCLMLSTPEKWMEAMKQNLLRTYPHLFTDPKDFLFALAYNSRPVFLAHAMDYQKIYWAYERYLCGEKFYIMCYPEQVKYLQKIMPDALYL